MPRYESPGTNSIGRVAQSARVPDIVGFVRTSLLTMEPRTYWEKAENYHTVQLEFTGNKIIYKDWWDPGHDPNRTEVTVPDFLDGKLHREIETEMGRRVLDEAIESVELLTTGGPGVAEPPDED